MCNANYDWVAISSLLISIGSMIAAFAAARFAKNAISQAKLDANRSLEQAKRIAERDHDDWAQRHWFELYIKADEACEAVEMFQVDYASTSSSHWETAERKQRHNSLNVTVRAAIRRAGVFPQHTAITGFLKALEFGHENKLVEPSYLQGLDDSLEPLRQEARVNPAVLERPMMKPFS